MNRKFLNGNAVKIIAIIAMVFNHLSAVGILMQNWGHIGRITFPIMAFMLVEGFNRTKNRNKYLLRLLLFCIISQLPFYLFTKCKGMLDFNYISEHLDIYYFTYIFSDKPVLFKIYNWIGNFSDINVIYTLFCGLLCLVCADKIKNRVLRYAAITAVIILSCPGDWGGAGVIGILILSKFPKEKRVVWGILVFWIAVILYNACGEILGKININHYSGISDIIGAILGSVKNYICFVIAIPILYFYNGERGKLNLKYLFYVFYPLHLLIIFLLTFKTTNSIM
jgi:hypothetical protein